MIGNMMIGRRRLLTLTGDRHLGARRSAGLARRAGTCRRNRPLGQPARHGRGARRLSLLGRQEVRLFRRHRDDAGARTFGCDRHGEARRPEPGRCRLSLARRVLARPGAGHAARLRLPDGWRATCSTSPSARARSRPTSRVSRARPSCSARAGWQSICDPMLKAAGVDITKVKYVDAGWPTWGTALKEGKGDAALSWEGLRAQWKGQGLDFDYFLGRDFSKLPANSFVIRKADFDDAVEEGPLRALLPRLGRGPRVRQASTRALRRRSSWSSSRASARR